MEHNGRAAGSCLAEVNANGRTAQQLDGISMDAADRACLKQADLLGGRDVLPRFTYPLMPLFA